RSFSLHHFACGSPHVGLHAAAAYCSDDAAIFPHQHPRTFKTRNGAVGMDNRSQGAALARAPHSNDLFEDVHEARLRRALLSVNVAKTGFSGDHAALAGNYVNQTRSVDWRHWWRPRPTLRYRKAKRRRLV